MCCKWYSEKTKINYTVGSDFIVERTLYLWWDSITHNLQHQSSHPPRLLCVKPFIYHRLGNVVKWSSQPTFMGSPLETSCSRTIVTWSFWKIKQRYKNKLLLLYISWICVSLSYCNENLISIVYSFITACQR